MLKTARNTSRAPLALTIAGALLLVAIISMAFVIASRSADLTNAVLQSQKIRGTASRELIALLDAETGQRGYLLTGRADYLAPFTVARQRSQSELATLAALSRTTTSIDIDIADIKRLATAKLGELDETISLRRQGHMQEALAIVLSDRGKNLMDQLRADLTHVGDHADRLLVEDLASLGWYTSLQRGVTAFGGLLAIVFSGLAFTLLLRSIRDTSAAQAELKSLNASLEDRVIERTTALTEANEEIQRFAYIVSHDLRAPLVNIMGFTSELEVGTTSLQHYLEGGEEEAKPAALVAARQDLPEAVKFIRAATGKMDRLINAILKLSREGRRELVSEAVNLNALFAGLVASLKHQIDETETTVEIEALPIINSDRLALEQVFGNLFDNALKYLVKGRPGRIDVNATGTQKMVTISIIDNGRGVAAQDRKRIFELFRRAGAQDKPGEGIGLAHTRALVRRLGGDIALSSEIGAGSAFRVSLPRSLSTVSSSPT